MPFVDLDSPDFGGSDPGFISGRGDGERKCGLSHNLL